MERTEGQLTQCQLTAERDYGEGTDMTSTVEPECIAEALALIDRSLLHMVKRELVSTNEVADLLLDVRMLLATAGAAVGN